MKMQKGVLLSLLAVGFIFGAAKCGPVQGESAPQQSLHQAVARGDNEAIEQMIVDRVDINQLNEQGRCVLSYAIMNGKDEQANLLIVRGANVNLPDAKYNTPLHYAAARRDVDIVKTLLQWKADINAQNDDLFTPLRLAVNNNDLETTRVLLENGAHTEYRDREGKTALFAAIFYNQAQMIELLLEHNAYPFAYDVNGISPIRYAEAMGHREIVKMLKPDWVKNLNVDSLSEPEAPVWFKSLPGKQSPEEFVGQIDVNYQDSWYNNLLHIIAASSRQNEWVPIARKLIEKGVNVNAENYLGQTPLHCILEHTFSQARSLELMKLLLDSGADVNARDREGNTPLHLATSQAFTTSIDSESVMVFAQTMISYGADVNAENYFLRTPLFRMVECPEKHFATLEYLIEKGADVDAVDLCNRTVLHEMLNSTGDVEEKALDLILDNCHNLSRVDYVRNMTPADIAYEYSKWDVVRKLVARGGKMNPFHSVQFVDAQFLQKMLDEGLDVNIENEDGYSMLQYAAIANRCENIECLVQAGANVNHKNDYGCTALHLAARNGHIEAVKLLLDLRANRNLKDRGGAGALALAVDKGHEQVAEILQSYRPGRDRSSSRRSSDGKSANSEDDSSEQVSQAKLEEEARRSRRSLWREQLIANGLRYQPTTRSHRDLQVAVLCEDIAKINQLLDAGADINEYDDEGMTPLVYAAFYDEEQVVILLLERGADIEKPDQGHLKGSPLIHAAFHGHYYMVKLLLEKGAQIEAVTDKGQTALHVAASGGELDVVKLLVDSGANRNHLRPGGETVLHSAANYCKEVRVLEYLLEKGLDINAMSKRKTPLALAVNGTNAKKTVRFLLDHGADINKGAGVGFAPLSAAMETYEVEMVKFLLEQGADVNVMDVNQRTLMHNVMGSTGVLGEEKTLELTRLVLSYNPDLTLVDGLGRSALLAACDNPKTKDVALLLIDAGADVNQADSWGSTPLRKAVEKNTPELVKVLLEQGANGNVQIYRKSLLEYAQSKNYTEVMAILAEYGIQ